MMSGRQEYLRDYMHDRSMKRRQDEIDRRGGCQVCGSRDRLKFLARDPAWRGLLGHLWSSSEDKLKELLAMNDLLCHEHYYQRRREEYAEQRT